MSLGSILQIKELNLGGRAVDGGGGLRTGSGDGLDLGGGGQSLELLHVILEGLLLLGGVG